MTWLFLPLTLLAVLGATWLLLNFILDKKTALGNASKSRPLLIRRTRTAGTIILAVTLWYAGVAVSLNSSHLVIGVLLGLAFTMLMSLISIWQLKKWGVILLATMILFFFKASTISYFNDHVNFICPAAVLVLGSWLVISLWKTL